MLKQYFTTLCIASLLLVTIQTVAAQTTPTANQTANTNQPSPAAVVANTLFQNQKWDEAVVAFEALTKAEPTNGMAWYRYGAVLTNLNRYADAIKPLQKAVEILRGPQAFYMLGSTYARLNDKEKAFENLNAAAAAGFAALVRLQNDTNLSSLKDDARFQKLVEAVRNTAYPCQASAKSHEFDFWVGEWDVQIAGQTVGTNIIQRLEEGCLIQENWTGTNGGSGKSMNFFNPTTGRWRQTYIGANQTIWEMTGEYRDGAMRYDGQVFSPRGTVLTRVTFYNLEPNRLRHTEDNSSDGGKTWTNVWDAIYVRKATSQKTN